MMDIAEWVQEKSKRNKQSMPASKQKSLHGQADAQVRQRSGSYTATYSARQVLGTS